MSTRLDADPRRFLRHHIGLVSELAGPQGELLWVWTVECAGGGARIALEEPFPDIFQDDGWLLTIPRLGCYEVAMKWRRGTTYGLKFLMPEVEQDHLAARLLQIAPRLQ